MSAQDNATVGEPAFEVAAVSIEEALEAHRTDSDKKSRGSSLSRRERDFGRLFTSLLFALFVVTLLTAILAGTNVYRTLYEESKVVDDQRLSLTLLTNDVRANDQIDAVACAWVSGDTVHVEEVEDDGLVRAALTGGASAGKPLEGSALVLRSTLDSGVYETRLYRHNGVIMKEYAAADDPYDPEKATPIVESSAFNFSYKDGLLTIFTDAGEASVALRSGGGER